MQNKVLENALRRKVRRIVVEIHFEKQFLKGLDILSEDVVRICRNKTLVNEGVSTVIGLLLSGPFIVKMFGKFVSFLQSSIDKLLKKYLGLGLGEPEIANKILEFAEKYHEKVMWIFEKVAGMMTKDPDKKELIAKLIFTGVMAGLLGHTLEEIVTTIKSTFFSSELLVQGMKAAIKTTEVIDGITAAMKAIAPKIMSLLHR